MVVRSYFYVAFALVAATLAGCAQQGGTLLPQTIAHPDLTPPNCQGQKTKKNYASVTAALKANGGTFCIPAFGGFGGKLKYPSVSPSIQLTLTTNTKNYNHQPKLGTGKAIFYLEFSTSGGTTFGSNLKSGGGLTGSQIVAGQPYTAYGQASLYGYKIKLGPCYTTATKGKYGGVIGGLGALVKGQNIPFAVSGVIEVYSGQQTNSQC
jgi:hypothetical protein